MKLKLFLGILIVSLFFSPLKVTAQPPPFSYRIGGTITINHKPMTQSIFLRDHFSIKVTKVGNIPLDPVAETSILTSENTYTIDIPVKNDYYPEAATPGEILEIHVYKGDKEVRVTVPVNAEITMGNAGETNYYIDISIIVPTALPAINLLLMDDNRNDTNR